MLLEVNYPEHVENIREIQAAIRAGDAAGGRFEDACDELEDNLNISTARKSGIERREEILGIIPLDTESLEDRRLKVQLRWHEKTPYTLQALMRKLDGSLGKGSYTISINYREKLLVCMVELKRKKMVKSVNDLLEDMLPLNIAYEVRIRYNQYFKLGKFTYGQLNAYTYDELRNEVI